MKPDRIKHLRHSVFRLSQPEFGEVMGTCTATISRWETGRTKPVGIADVLLRACDKAVKDYGEQRIRGVDWQALLRQKGLMTVLAGILNFATTDPQPPAEPVYDEFSVDDQLEDLDDLDEEPVDNYT